MSSSLQNNKGKKGSNLQHSEGDPGLVKTWIFHWVSFGNDVHIDPPTAIIKPRGFNQKQIFCS
ncbi:hypothetical protein GCM10007049_10090 [Echinicola pacifica]|uniref:Uncharacterized protein n=1 Tax=Echinicola pacifica TaxID=346377 RepID=A0A918UM01_9BACT|nr:hypothetical protein GCM10007049_10090 [Echinicola pacifica]